MGIYLKNAMTKTDRDIQELQKKYPSAQVIDKKTALEKVKYVNQNPTHGCKICCQRISGNLQILFINGFAGTEGINGYFIVRGRVGKYLVS